MANDELLNQIHFELILLRLQLHQHPEDWTGLYRLHDRFPFNSSLDALRSLLLDDGYDTATLARILETEHLACRQRFPSSSSDQK